MPAGSPSASPSHVPDYKLLEATLDAMPVKRPDALADQPLNLCLDKGYDYDGPRQIAYDYNLTAHIRCRGEESKTSSDLPNYQPRRWVVERVESIKFCGELRLRRLVWGVICGRVPFSERLPQSAVEGLGAGLQEQVGAGLGPLHLLLRGEALADHEVD